MVHSRMARWCRLQLTQVISRFVRPGAVRLGTSGAPSGIKVAAFQNVDGSIAVQFINTGGSATKVNVKVNGGGTEVSVAKAWVTDNTREIAVMDVLFTGGLASASIPSRSMATVLLAGESTAD